MNIKHNRLTLSALGIILTATAAISLTACGGGSSSSNNQVTPPVQVVAPVVAPVIVTQPANQILSAVGASITFSVVANGDAPLSYQWRRDGADVTGATGPSYVLQNTLVSDTSSIWSVVVRNAGGSATSINAKLTMPAISLFAGSSGGRGSRDGMGAAARFYSPHDMTVGGDGTLYVVDGRSIRKVRADGLVTTLVDESGFSFRCPTENFCVPGVENFYPGGIAVDSKGNVYTTDSLFRGIYKITPSGLVQKLSIGTLGTADGSLADAQFMGPSDVAIDKADNIYIADTRGHTIRKISVTGQVTTLAGSYEHQDSTDGRGAAAGFHSVDKITVNAAGTLYVLDNRLLRKIDSDGLVTTIKTFDSGWYRRYLAADDQGYIYVASYFQDSVQKFNSMGVAIPLPAPLFSTSGIAVDKTGNIYSAQETELRKLSTTGVLSSLAGKVSQFGFKDGVGVNAAFGRVANMALDASGSLYVNDAQNNSLRKISSTGQVSTSFGLGLKEQLVFDGPSYRCFDKCSMTIDAENNIYVTNTYGHTILKISSTGIETTFAGNGYYGSNDGLGSAASLRAPAAIAIDANGNLYVTEYSTIRKISPAGMVSTLAGNPSVCGLINGIVSEARFCYPAGIAVDGAGNIYVAEGGNNVIRKISATGIVTTLAGKFHLPEEKVSITDGLGDAAVFSSLSAMTIDRTGNLYVIDSKTVRKISPAGLVTTIAGLQGELDDIFGIVVDANNVLYVSTTAGVWRIAQ